VPTILVSLQPTKERFRNIVEQLRSYSLLGAIRETGDSLTIKVFQKPPTRQSRRKINVWMFLFTVATLMYAGYFIWSGALFGLTASNPLQDQLNAILSPGASPYLEAATFAMGLLAIIGLHEFGHKAATNYHGMDASFPYFIPGPPPIGTFGALISLKSPPANRDQLFDLGLSGPVVGFIVTIAVSMIGMLFGPPITQTRLDQIGIWNSTCIAQLGVNTCSATISFPAYPLLLVFLSNISSQLNPNVFVNGQLIFAAQIGALLTFLNVIPAWQLDGGHISRAVFGPRVHRFATLIGLGILLWTRFFAFALLVLVMMSLSGRGLAGVEPLDDVSPISNSRKILYVFGLAMLVLTFANAPI
jgi:membrane-associated protease RseP (regulator of RpoE activity)